jgi:large subunit ribosomal protein L20
MTRIKRGNIARKRRNKIISFNKGFRGSHNKLFTVANQQNMKAFKYSYADRRKKKNYFKCLWIKRINNASKNYNKIYNKTIHELKKKKILLNKKIFSSISIYDPQTFKKLINA